MFEILKRNLALSIISLLISIVMAVFGPQTQPLAVAQARPQMITFAGGSMGGAWQVMAEGLAETVRRENQGWNVNVVVGGDAQNVVRTDNGMVEISLVYLPTLKTALEGTHSFKEKFKNIRVLAMIHPATYQFFILKNTGINSFTDVKAKKLPLQVGINQPGSMMELLGLKVLEQYALSEKEIASLGGKVQRIAMPSNIELMRNGQMHAMSQVGPLPFPQVIELAMSTDLTMLSVSETVLSAIAKEFNVERSVIPANSYKFVTKDVPSFRTFGLMVANAKISDDMAYKIVKSIDKNRPFLGTVDVQLKGLSPGFMANSFDMPLHPGAEKYYKEIAAIK